jgi:hypothetical protein
MSHGHPHMPHQQHPSTGEQLGPFRLELLIAILLGLAAIIGAVGAYWGHVSEGHSVTKYNSAVGLYTEALRSSTDSNLFYAQGNTRLVQYQQLFLEFVKALEVKDRATARYIHDNLMDDRLKKMVDWWVNGKNTGKTPFNADDPYYVIVEYPKAAELDKQTSEQFTKGREAFNDGLTDERRSNRYTIVEVLIASALFLYGIAGVTRRYSIKVGFLVVGFVAFVLACIQVARVRWG